MNREPRGEEKHEGPRWRRGFWSLIATQFQGAFSDNVLKWVVTFIALAAGLSQSRRNELVVLVIPLLFAVPFLLFSMAGGYLADRYSKRSVTIGTKLLEIVVALVALFGLARGSLTVECAAVFLISTQAALFGPSKYGLLPELLPEKRLSWGNGILELGTFLAIITGTMAAGLFAEAFRGREQWSGAILAALAAAGLLASLGITRVPAADPAKKFRANPLGDLRAQIRIIRRDRLLWLAVLGNVFFWFLGSLLLINIVLYSADILRLSEAQTSLLMAAVSLGIGVGSFAAGYLSGNKIEYGLVPMGMLGMAVMAAVLARPGLGYGEVAVDLALLGFSAGFFAVPVNALIQYRPLPEHKGGVIASANLLSFVGIGLQPVVQYLLIRFGHPSPPRVFLLCGLATIAATVAAILAMPDALLRAGLWLATHSLYRIRIEGRDNVPERGGAVFLSPRISFLDALLLVSSTDRKIRFLLEDARPPRPPRWLARLLGAIPLEPGDVRGSLKRAGKALESGEVVCVFSDDARAGEPARLPSNVAALLAGVSAPVVPVRMNDTRASLASFGEGRAGWRLPRRLLFPVTVSYGAPLGPARA
jgi:acyl-[acyl-carrier-protein]-phospholipid O-acyltransferase / long-chain-fatty-acid--[acyl-carrier-protein] ligase